MRSFNAVVASVLLVACGGGRTGNSRAAAKIEAAEVKTCPEACERVDTCWELQYGQEDGEAEQAECEARCEGMTPEEQPGYLEAMGASTECPTIMDM